MNRADQHKAFIEALEEKQATAFDQWVRKSVEAIEEGDLTHLIVFELMKNITFRDALTILGGCEPPCEADVTHTIRSGSRWTDIVIHAAKVAVLNRVEGGLTRSWSRKNL